MSSTGRIHPTAIIDASAELAPDVEVGPFCCIGKQVRIGAGTILHSRVDILQNTQIGSNCQLHTGVVLGGPPQDYKYKGEESFVIIGDDNILREYCTVHCATGEGCVTRIGSRNMFMAYVHMGHNCDIGSGVTIASYVGVSGHVLIEDDATVGGICGLHQGSRIGRLAMVGGMAGVSQDVPPYMMVSGAPAKVFGLNAVGLKKAGVSRKVREEIKEAFRLIYRSNLNMSQAIEAIETNIPASPEIAHLLTFLRNTRKGHNGRGNTPNPNADIDEV